MQDPSYSSPPQKPFKLFTTENKMKFVQRSNFVIEFTQAFSVATSQDEKTKQLQ